MTTGTQHRRQREVKAFPPGAAAWTTQREPLHPGPNGQAGAEGWAAFQQRGDSDATGRRRRRFVRRLSHASDDLLSSRHWRSIERTRFVEAGGHFLRSASSSSPSRQGQRWTAISDSAIQALREYLDRFRGWHEGRLFQSVAGQPLKKHHMNVMFSRHPRRAGVPQGNPHQFRHAFATGRFERQLGNSRCSICSATPAPSWCGVTQRRTIRSRPPRTMRCSARQANWLRPLSALSSIGR